MNIRINNSTIDLPEGFSIEIEETNPVFNDVGTQSLPATVPSTPRNMAIFHAPHRLDSGDDPNQPTRRAIVSDGPEMWPGRLNLTEAGPEGFTFNIGFDNSELFDSWRSKKLADLTPMGIFRPLPRQGGDTIDWLIEDMYLNYKSGDPQNTDFAVFPLAISTENESQTKYSHYWEILNVPRNSDMVQPTNIKRKIDGEWKNVTVPKGYGLTAFLRVWKVLELIFGDLGVEIESNPFKENRELSRLVILNNAADSCCVDTLYYDKLMPDVTVETFMNSLWVRFGLVYQLDGKNSVVRLKFIKDIVLESPCINLQTYSSEQPTVIYESPKYIRLSASTSIEGAAPATERFEDFTKGLSLDTIAIGTGLSTWTNTGTQEEPEWDGDLGDDWWNLPEDPDPEDPEWPEPEWPEPDDDPIVQIDPEDPPPGYDEELPGRDDEYEAEYDNTRSGGTSLTKAAARSGNNSLPPDSFLSRETETGIWYKLDAMNSRTKQSSSSFFNWDPAPEGIEPLDLVSEDECVPVKKITNSGTDMGNGFSGICPLYLFGARHYHTFIKGTDDDNEEGVSTPLAFLFAYQIKGKTIGRVNAEGSNGELMVNDDGTRPTLSLLFQFHDGLFNRFWRDYDEILRHGNRTIENRLYLPRTLVGRIDMLTPVMIGNIRCLIDTSRYDLPGNNILAVDMSFRPLQTQGEYDIAKEQNVPRFAAACRHLEWFVWGDEFGPGLNTAARRALAVEAFTELSEYTGPPVTAVLSHMEREGLTWETDPKLPSPQVARTIWCPTYRAILYYDIMLGGEKIGSYNVFTDYRVLLRCRWMLDR